MSMDREHEEQAWTLASHRRQLVNASDGIDLDLGSLTLRISNLPLFRKRDESLEQAIRVRTPGGAAETFVVELRNGDELVDTASIAVGERAQSTFLFVPEVTARSTITVSCTATDGTSVTTPFTVIPQRKWTIHLAHHSHYDIGYTDTQNEVMASQMAYIDSALELATLTDDWPVAARFRWNVEVNWPLQQWLRLRPQWAREELARRVREGRIEVHALPFSMHTEAYSFDELAQQLTFTAEVREALDIEVVTAMQTDVPGATIGLSTLLTDAGVKYLVVAHNYAGRSIPHHLDGQDLERPFRWQAPDGEKVLVWYTDTLNGSAYMEAMHVGFGAGSEDVLGTLPEYLSALARQRYPYGNHESWIAGSTAGLTLADRGYPYDVLHLRVQGAYADNASTSLLPSRIVREWNETWAWPRLRMSVNRDFFADIEERHGEDFPTYTGDWTDWWADGIGSAAVALGKNRQSQGDIRTAQTLHALADGLTDAPLPSMPAEVRSAYEAMALFDEHTWGAANPWSQDLIGESSGEIQWTRKHAYALQAEETTRSLLDGGLQRFSTMARVTRDDLVASLLVFNPSSFERSDLVRVFVPEREVDLATVELLDLATDEPVSFIVEPQDNARYRLRGAWIRFLARDLPPIGYARYGLRPGATVGVRVVPEPSNSLTTERIRVEVDPGRGTITSLVDLISGADLVGSRAPFGFGGVVLDHYASAAGFNHLSSRIGLGAGPWLLGRRAIPQHGHIIHHRSNAVFEQMTMRLELPGLDWLETTLTLPHRVPRVDIRHHLHKPPTMAKESLYVAFPFAGKDPAFGFEVTGGWVNPGDPHVPGSAHYFRAIRHAASVTAEGLPPVAWATREAPLVQVGDIHLPYAPFPPTIPDYEAHPGTIHSWALNNIWDTNFPPEQGGEMSFTYSVAMGTDESPADLARTTGAAIAQPLVGMIAPVVSPVLASFPNRASFVRSLNPEVEVTHLAASRPGTGLAVHLRSHARDRIETWLKIEHLPVRGAQIGTFLETGMAGVEITDGMVAVTVAPGELRVVWLDLEHHKAGEG